MDKTVMSTRIRLARNLKNVPFPRRMSLEQKHEVCQKVKSAAMSLKGYDFDYIDMEPVSYTHLDVYKRQVFNKRRNLYALNFAKKTKRSEFILCEGYMDAIALHRAGFDNAVAALGTAVTEDHARLIRRYTENVVLCLDSDGAGRAATQKALSVLPKAGLNVRVVTVTGGKDPDEMLREEDGKKQFERLLAASQLSLIHI